MEEGMSVSARARTMTNSELIDFFELASDAERASLAYELYVRLFRVVHGFRVSPQQHSLFTNK